MHEGEVGRDQYVLVADGDEDRAVNELVGQAMPDEWANGKHAAIQMSREDLMSDSVDSILADRAPDALRDGDVRKRWEAKDEKEARREYEAERREFGSDDDEPEEFSYQPDEERWSEHAREYALNKVHPYLERMRERVHSRVSRKNTFITSADDFFEIANEAGYHTVNIGIRGYEGWARTVDIDDYEVDG